MRFEFFLLLGLETLVYITLVDAPIAGHHVHVYIPVGGFQEPSCLAFRQRPLFFARLDLLFTLSPPTVGYPWAILGFSNKTMAWRLCVEGRF